MRKIRFGSAIKNMDNLIKNLIKRAKGISLNGVERAEIRHRLSAFARGHEALGAASRTPWLIRILKPALAGVILAGLAGGGVSFAAENSLPGDPLYPVKINVIEPVQGWFAVSSEARADWEAKLAERRLEEAEKLAAENRLDDEKRAEAESEFQKHAEKAKEHIAALEAGADLNAASNISSRIEASFKAHGKILQKLMRGGEVGAKADAEADIASTTRAAIEARISAEEGPDEQSAAEGKEGAAQSKIQEVQQFLSGLDASTTAQANARLTEADTVFAQGQAELSAGHSGAAFVLFQQAMRIAQEAKLLIEAHKNFEIELKLNGNFHLKGDHEDQRASEGEGSAKTEAELDLNL